MSACFPNAGLHWYPLVSLPCSFDPLGLKPTDEEDLKDMQTKELNNGRLAMIAITGFVVQVNFLT